MESHSKGTQCDDIIFDQVKRYLEIFSENNASVKSEGDRSILLMQVSLLEEFEREKKEMRTRFAGEKAALKKAYENEIKDYADEVEKLRRIIECRMSEIESKLEEQYKKKEEKEKVALETERKSLKLSIQEQMDLIADVESEIKRILKRLLIELKKYEPEKCSSLENDLCSSNLKESCVMYLKKIFDEEKGNKQMEEGKVIAKDKIEAREAELYEVGEAFRKQKKELTEIFMKEKKHLEDEIERNCLEYKKKLDKEYEERMSREMRVWQETIKEYEREVGILRFEREQMDRNYCVEIDRLKLETEKEKVEICAKYMKEREQFRKTLSDTVMTELVKKNKLHKI